MEPLGIERIFELEMPISVFQLECFEPTPPPKKKHRNLLPSRRLQEMPGARANLRVAGFQFLGFSPARSRVCGFVLQVEGCMF